MYKQPSTCCQAWISIGRIGENTGIKLVTCDILSALKVGERLRNTAHVLFYTNIFRSYEVIGTTYGSTASTTFKLPNPAGYVLGVIGSGIGPNGSNLTTRTAGQFIGEETHTLTIAEMPTHNHGITDPGHAHGYSNQANSTDVQEPITVRDVADNGNVGQTTGSNTTGITINNTGGSNAHNNMQPTLFIGNMFIFSGLIEGKVPTQNNGMNYPFGGNGIY